MRGYMNNIFEVREGLYINFNQVVAIDFSYNKSGNIESAFVYYAAPIRNGNYAEYLEKEESIKLHGFLSKYNQNNS